MKHFTWIAIFFVTVAVLSLPSRADSLVVSAGNVQGAAGSDVEVPIRIKGASDLKNLEVRLTCDPAILEVTKVEPGEATGSANVSFDTDDKGYTGMGFYGGDAVNGDGVAFKVFAHVRGTSGQKSPLTLDFAQAWNGTNQTTMLVSSENGELTVQGTSLTALPPWVWIAVASVAAVLLALGLLLIARRRKPGAARASVEEEIPTYGTPSTFKHHCTECQQIIELPSTAIGKKFKCAGCGSLQVAGR